MERLRAVIASTSAQSDDDDMHGIASLVNDERWPLAARGVSPEEMKTPANRTVRDRQGQADRLLSAFKNNEQREDLVRHERDALESLVDALRADGVHDGLRKAAWGTAAGLATAIAHRGDDSVLPILLEASRQPEPVPNEARARHFATSPGWGGGAARLEAVDGSVRSRAVVVATPLRVASNSPVTRRPRSGTRLQCASVSS